MNYRRSGHYTKLLIRVRPKVGSTLDMKTFVATFVTPYVRANKPDDWEVHSFDDQFTCCFYFMPQYNLDSEVRSVPKPENLIVYADVLRPFERRFKGGVQIA